MSAADSFSVEIKLVSKEDLPAQCPPKDSSGWNMHPKVFLSFNAEGNASCPYCGAKYKLGE